VVEAFDDRPGPSDRSVADSLARTDVSAGPTSDYRERGVLLVELLQASEANAGKGRCTPGTL